MRRSANPLGLFSQVIGLAKTFKNSELLNSEMYGGWQRDTVREVDIVASSFMLIDTSLWRQLKGFDAALFMHGEDADLCLRARRVGASPFITPAAEIIHHGSASEPTRSGQLMKLLTAKSTLVRKHWPVGAHWLGRSLLEAWSFGRWLKAATLNFLNPCHNYNENAEAWSQVLAARKIWHRGYDFKNTRKSWTAIQRQNDTVADPILKVG